MSKVAIKRIVRISLRYVLRFALRLRASDYTPACDSVTLVLAPHQDDESLGCGGLIAVKRLSATPVHVAYLTDGSASHPRHPTLTPAELTTRRAQEAHAALRQFGVEPAAVVFLGAPDGRLDRLTQSETSTLTTRLTNLLVTVRPDEIFLPFRHDGSSEHEAAFRHFTVSLQASGLRPRVFEFPVWSWWNPLLVLQAFHRLRHVTRLKFPDAVQIKRAALAAYVTQVTATPPWTEPLLSAEFISSFSSAEEFFFEL